MALTDKLANCRWRKSTLQQTTHFETRLAARPSSHAFRQLVYVAEQRDDVLFLRERNHQVAFGSVANLDVRDHFFRLGIHDTNLLFAADADISEFAIRREAESVNLADHGQGRDLWEVVASEVMYVDQLVLDVTGPDLLLIRTDGESVAAASFGTQFFRDVVTHGREDFSCVGVRRLKADQTVDVLVEPLAVW